jgi:hypothetical protein
MFTPLHHGPAPFHARACKQPPGHRRAPRPLPRPRMQAASQAPIFRSAPPNPKSICLAIVVTLASELVKPHNGSHNDGLDSWGRDAADLAPRSSLAALCSLTAHVPRVRLCSRRTPPQPPRPSHGCPCSAQMRTTLLSPSPST